MKVLVVNGTEVIGVGWGEGISGEWYWSNRKGDDYTRYSEVSMLGEVLTVTFNISIKGTENLEPKGYRNYVSQ